MTTPEAGLYTKLAEVMAAVGYVQKTGYNSFHKYHYVTEEDLINEVRAHLTSRNVMLIPSVVDIMERPITTDKGKQSTVTTVRVAFTFIDGDTGAMHRAEWAGAGDDGADKGIYKAYTGAMKYFLMKAFMIATGDDPERDVRPAPATDPRIDAKRAEMISELVSKALGAGIGDSDLSTMFTAAGSFPERINRQAVADLTQPQSEAVVSALNEFLSKAMAGAAT